MFNEVFSHLFFDHYFAFWQSDTIFIKVSVSFPLKVLMFDIQFVALKIVMFYSQVVALKVVMFDIQFVALKIVMFYSQVNVSIKM